MYSTGRGISQGTASTAATRVESGGGVGGIDWIHYIVYFLVALLVVWGILFVLIRTSMVGPNDWLYENTKGIPGIGEKSWARQTATTTPATSTANNNNGRVGSQ